MAWSEAEQINTVRVLKETPAYAFGKNGCLMKNLDGSKGFIRFDDAISHNFRIYPLEKKDYLSFRNIDQLLKAGWIAD